MWTVRCSKCGEPKEMGQYRIALGKTMEAICRDCDPPPPPERRKPKLRLVEKVDES